MSERILQDKRVRNIISLDINFKDRHLKTKARLKTTEKIKEIKRKRTEFTRKQKKQP